MIKEDTVTDQDWAFFIDAIFESNIPTWGAE
jgi:hypothetical protein